MDKRDDEFLKRIKETFRIEAEEHLSAFSAGLINLEKPQSHESYEQIIESMFRNIHSLKGAARSIDQREIESICQPLESVFSGLKRKVLALSPASFDLFYKTATSISKLILESGSGLTATDRQYHRELIRKLNDISTGGLQSSDIGVSNQVKEEEPVKPINAVTAEKHSGSDISRSERPLSAETIRIRISKLDQLLLQAEELIQAKKAIHQRINELQAVCISLSVFKAESLKTDARFLEGSSALWKEQSERKKSSLNILDNQLAELTHSMEKDQYSLNNMVDAHNETMRQVLMLPISTITEALPGMVRKISGDQAKDIKFVINGTELEIDKRILEELKDPLIHLLRNCIDHGIGKPEERISQNKTGRGTILLEFIARERGMLEISLSDDGKGINTVKLIKAAIKSGILTDETAKKIDPGEILSLIFLSGVSTSPIITDISGRGLGLSIVHEKVEKLNGKISVETELNKGTTFHILLPMTLSTFRGIMVRLGEFMFIIPTANVERVMKLDREMIKTVKNNDTMLINEQILRIADLRDVLGLVYHNPEGSGSKDPVAGNSNQIGIVVLVSGENRMAFRVDEVIDEQQVLVKDLGKLLNRVKNISGATVLGSGRVVPVLHVADLIKSANISAGKIKVHVPIGKTSGKIKKILVADDSITSRTMIKSILETAGYQVSTAFDGTDAFTKARTDEFDLIVSDVDMPRMNGFELIARIKHDKKLCEIPVVLITALGSKEDREHGIDVGADAYINKSSFDQFYLLEIIRKLI